MRPGLAKYIGIPDVVEEASIVEEDLIVEEDAIAEPIAGEDPITQGVAMAAKIGEDRILQEDPIADEEAATADLGDTQRRHESSRPAADCTPLCRE